MRTTYAKSPTVRDERLIEICEEDATGAYQRTQVLYAKNLPDALRRFWESAQADFGDPWFQANTLMAVCDGVCRTFVARDLA